MKKCKDMKFHIGAELRIYPDSVQRRVIALNDGISRFIYNRKTSVEKELYALKKYSNVCPAYAERIASLEQVMSSKKELLNIIPFASDPEIDSLAIDNAIKNHNRAWEQFRKVPGTGIPGFHKKSYVQSYQTNAHYEKDAVCWGDGNVHFTWKKKNEEVPHFIQLPKLGTVRFRCSDSVKQMLLSHSEDTRVGTVAIRRDNCGDYYAVLQLSSDTPFVKPMPKTGRRAGIDVNLTNLYTDSDGNVVDNPKPARGSKKKLTKAQRKLSHMSERAKKEGRKLRESSNYQKQRIRVAKIQRKVSDYREDYLNVQAKHLVENQDLIVSEDIKGKNLMKNHKLAYSIADVSWGRFLALIEQKSSMYGKTYIRVPAKNTTQTCSNCHHVMEGDEKIPLGVEEWDCPKCGAHHVRDHNSAKNVLERGLALLACN